MPAGAEGSVPTNLGGLHPGELLARGLQSVKMSSTGAHGWIPPEVADVARLFPHYEVTEMLGRGGMGAVYKARQVALDRFVAIKILPLEISVSEDFVNRFVREARAMARLNHPNILSVHDFGQTAEGHLFFVMEFVEGANLHEIIHQVGLDPEQALSLAGQICTALAYAHGKGVVHRDIKPANVMVDAESHVKVADFGLARLTESTAETSATTKTGLVMGTPDYMAPEQKGGMNVDQRADIYSVGVVLYEMLCRKVPRGIFARPSECIGCDERIDHIVHRAMQQEPALRYQNTVEMKAAVDTARRPPPAPPGIPAGPAPPPAAVARRPVRRMVGAAVVAALAAAGFFTMKPKPPAKQSETIPKVAAVPPAETKVSAPPPAPPVPADAAPMEPPKLASLAKPPAIMPKAEPAPAATPTPGTPAPRNATPAPPPPSTTGKWLAEQQPQWRAAFAREVTGPFEKSAGDLQRQYRAALEDQLAAATRDARLDAAVAFRAELKVLADPGIPPTDESALLPALKTMRSAYRKTLATFEAERIAKAKIVHARCDTILAQNQTLLTQRQRLDEALEMKACREKLAAAWLQPPPSPAERAIAVATKDQPFVNSLGMRFVPLRPSTGLAHRSHLLFAVWPARVEDFRAFVKASGGKFDYEKGEMTMILKSNGWWTRGWDYGWSNPGFEQTDKHPVVGVSWEDARAFCIWLTAKENLPPGWSYRMPTDAEWNEAVGLTQPGEGARENRRKAAVYPWGTAWPPPNGAGNFAGEEARASDRPLDWEVLEGYRDKFPYTAPVGTFPANALGIADLAGNVRQWC